MSKKITDPVDAAEFNESNVELPEVPFVYFFNSQANASGPIAKGTFYVVQSDVGVIDGLEPQTLTFRNQNTETVYFFPEIHIAPLKSGSRWYDTSSNRDMLLEPNFKPSPEMSLKKKTRIYCICRELNNMPVILGVSGKTHTQSLTAATQQFKAQVLNAANQVWGKMFPPYCFWLALTAGETVSYEKAQATSIALIEGKRDKAALTKLFVGQETITLCESKMAEAEAWQKSFMEQTTEEYTNGFTSANSDYQEQAAYLANGEPESQPRIPEGAKQAAMRNDPLPSADELPPNEEPSDETGEIPF